MEKRPDPQAQAQTEAQAGAQAVTAPADWGITLFWVACGAVAGWLVTLLAHWLVSLPAGPFRGPAKLLTKIPEPGLTIGAVVVGAVVGLLVGLTAVGEAQARRRPS